jgi:acid-activated urea channel
MLGTILLYVGMVLMSNGLATISKIEGKSIAVMNLFTGGLSLVLNIVALSWGIIDNKPESWFFASATGLLFAFTYLYVALNVIFNLDQRLYGWYSLFVAINSIPAGILCFQNFGGNWIYGLIWWAWGILWLTGFLVNNLHWNISKFSGWLGFIEGIVTAWIPGFLMLLNVWPK